MRYSYKYGELIDYLEDIKGSKETSELINMAIEVEKNDYDIHCNGSKNLNMILRAEGIAVTSYERGCINLKEVTQEIKRALA